MICTILEVFYVWRYHKQAFSAGSTIVNGTKLSINSPLYNKRRLY